MTILLVLISLSGVPEAEIRLFNEANMAYEQGDFAAAVEKYTRLSNSRNVKSPVLFYNLGNAWFRQDAMGQAILHYEAALALAPDFEPARKNLDEAMQRTKRQLPRPDPRQMDTRLVARYYPLSPLQSLWLVHLFIAATMLLMIGRYYRQATKMRWIIWLTPIAAVVLYVLTVAVNIMHADAPYPAVTLTEEAPVYFSMSESEQPRFLLYEGDRVLVDRIEGDWMRVTAHGGERGWIRENNLGIVEYVIM